MGFLRILIKTRVVDVVVVVVVVVDVDVDVDVVVQLPGFPQMSTFSYKLHFSS